MGSHASEWAEQASDPAESDRLSAAAAEKYAAALKIKPDKHETLINWASLLIQRTHRVSDPVDRERLLAEAEEKCRAALKLNPGNT